MAELARQSATKGLRCYCCGTMVESLAKGLAVCSLCHEVKTETGKGWGEVKIMSLTRRARGRTEELGKTRSQEAREEKAHERAKRDAARMASIRIYFAKMCEKARVDKGLIEDNRDWVRKNREDLVRLLAEPDAKNPPVLVKKVEGKTVVGWTWEIVKGLSIRKGVNQLRAEAKERESVMDWLLSI